MSSHLLNLFIASSTYHSFHFYFVILLSQHMSICRKGSQRKKGKNNLKQNYLFIPICSPCHPHQNYCLHEGSTHQSNPNSLCTHSLHNTKLSFNFKTKEKNVHSAKTLLLSTKLKFEDDYLRTKIEIEAEEGTKGHSNYVIATNIYIRDESLPPAPNRDPFKDQKP